MPSKERDWKVLRAMMGKVYDAQISLRENDEELAATEIGALLGLDVETLGLSPEALEVAQEIQELARSAEDTEDELGNLEAEEMWFMDTCERLVEDGVLDEGMVDENDCDSETWQELYK